jgi:hypothetical protein
MFTNGIGIRVLESRESCDYDSYLMMRDKLMGSLITKQRRLSRHPPKQGGRPALGPVSFCGDVSAQYHADIVTIHANVNVALNLFDDVSCCKISAETIKSLSLFRHYD